MIIQRTLALACQLVCVAALAVLAVEPSGESPARKREVVARVLQFKEHLLASSADTPAFLADVAYSEVVVGWLVDQMLAAAKSHELLEQTPWTADELIGGRDDRRA